MISDYHILKIKDFENLLSIGPTQALKYKRDIQKEYHLFNKPVLFIHFKRYFNIETTKKTS